MAFKHVTSGLTDQNAVINEIIDFAQNDLAQPWTLEYNLDATVFSTSPNDQSLPDRRTCLSIVPSGANTEKAFDDARNPSLPSPTPQRIYVRLKAFQFSSLYDVMQLIGSGYDAAGASGSPQPAVARSFNADPNDTQAFFQQSQMDLSATGFFPGMEFYNQNRGPFTSLYLFGPNQESPQNPNIPNYIYGVLEQTPAVYSHFMFGEMKRFVPISGGWACFGHGYDNIESPLSSANLMTWSDINQASSQGGICSLAADVGQVQNSQGDWTLSPEPTTKWFTRGRRGSSSWNDVSGNNFHHQMEFWGHTVFNQWMRGSSISLISGFVPLAGPIVNLNDEQATGGAMPWSDEESIVMPTCYPEDFFLGDIDQFDPGVQVTVGGITVIPFPIISKLPSQPNSDYGGYFYRVRA